MKHGDVYEYVVKSGIDRLVDNHPSQILKMTKTTLTSSITTKASLKQQEVRITDGANEPETTEKPTSTKDWSSVRSSLASMSFEWASKRIRARTLQVEGGPFTQIM